MKKKFEDCFYAFVLLANLVIWPYLIFSADKPNTTNYESRDRLRNNLRDPDSLEIIEERPVGDKTYFKYRAKNGFGGYTVEEGIY